MDSAAFLITIAEESTLSAIDYRDHRKSQTASALA
jgi:hypothetical protein